MIWFWQACDNISSPDQVQTQNLSPSHTPEWAIFTTFSERKINLIIFQDGRALQAWTEIITLHDAILYD